MTAAKASPGQISYGSAGMGSPAHMAVEQLRYRSHGLDFLHIPYKGAVETVQALRGGQIDFSIVVLSTALPLIKAGVLKALAVTGASRLPQIPSVPTFSESGVPGYVFTSWGALALPAGTPSAIVDQLFEAVRQAASAPDFVSLQESMGSNAELSKSPEEFRGKLQGLISSEVMIVRNMQQQLR
jgi:tripartite-type tricarboxylate transporter receptor subunit TctC